MRIESKDLLRFHYYTYGEPFTGSAAGMRYRLSRVTVPENPDAERELFEAAAWPEPYSEAFTDPGRIIKKRFAFSEEGKEEAVCWLNAVYQEICADRSDPEDKINRTDIHSPEQ